MSHKNEFGCLMAFIAPSVSQNIIKYGKTMVPDDNLYIVPDDDYGREVEPHVTLKYGFTKDLTDDQIAEIINGIGKFSVVAEGVSCFKNELFDVVKFDIKKTEPLLTMRDRCNKFPNQDSFPSFHPHTTIAYVKKDTFPHTIKNKNIEFNVDRMKYSGIDGKSRWYDLK